MHLFIHRGGIFMDFNNAIEKRFVDKGRHSLVLEISADEYKKDYDDLNDDYAMNILERYMEFRGDDGRPSDAKIDYDPYYNIVRISANVNYLDNDHTTYRM